MAKHRSPAYPATGLSEAIERVRRLFDKEKRTLVQPLVAATDLGYKSLNGPSRTMLSALKKYGLIEELKQGLRVSDLAVAILHPTSEEQRLAALREAAVRPDLFRELQQTHANGSNDNIAHFLIQRGFSAQAATQAVTAFRDTMVVAKLDASGNNPPEDGAESEVTTMGTTIAFGKAGAPAASNAAPVSLRWPLPGGVIAELRFTGPVTKEHFDILERYLAIAKETAPTV